MLLHIEHEEINSYFSSEELQGTEGKKITFLEDPLMQLKIKPCNMRLALWAGKHISAGEVRMNAKYM